MGDGLNDIIDNCDFDSNAAYLFEFFKNIIEEYEKSISAETCSVRIGGETLENF